MKPYDHLILGGTFDHFHAGHELFLRRALSSSGRLTIGIATSRLYSNKQLVQTIEDYDEREKNVKNFVAQNKKEGQIVKLIPINDIYGTSLTDVTIDGIVVTEETKRGADLINEKREKAGMKPLRVIIVPLVKASDGLPISSFRIRYGDIDRQGTSYFYAMTGRRIYYLPDAVRPLLREPLGTLFRGGPEAGSRVVKKIKPLFSQFLPPMTFAIGDIICQNLVKEGISGFAGVIDYKSRRKALNHALVTGFPEILDRKYRNRPGTIQMNAVSAIRQLRNRYMKDKQPSVLHIVGEEDLLALPAMLLAPLNSFVLYGQYDQGVVVVRVTEAKKNEVLGIFRKFTA